MRVTTVLSASLAFVASVRAVALPAGGPAEAEADFEMILFKRDAVLTPRDLELAELHGVDINEMFKHAMIKRSDGDDYTIWVHNSFSETAVDDETDGELSGPEKRQLSARPISGVQSIPNFLPWMRECTNGDFNDHTSSGSPTTGGTQEMERWANRTRGKFIIGEGSGSINRNFDLVVAGSNKGTNSCFLVRKHPLDENKEARISTLDISYRARESMNRFQRQINGQWKMGASGGMRCSPKPLFSIEPKIDWSISWTSQRA